MNHLTKEQKASIKLAVAKYSVYIPKNELEIIFNNLSKEYQHLNYWDMRDYISIQLKKEVCL
jgi:uncharacterized protein YacL (UPF0231 family)